LAGCSDTGTASEIAATYALSGYDDWFLSSKDEMTLLYQQRNEVGGFNTGVYWSSSETGSFTAWNRSFHTSGGWTSNNKSNIKSVRAVRGFKQNQ